MGNAIKLLIFKECNILSQLFLITSPAQGETENNAVKHFVFFAKRGSVLKRAERSRRRLTKLMKWISEMGRKHDNKFPFGGIWTHSGTLHICWFYAGVLVARSLVVAQAVKDLRSRMNTEAESVLPHCESHSTRAFELAQIFRVALKATLDHRY